jgi:glutathione synthase/RimK-type ligase-like ATP-grasp enzyme
MAKGASSVHRRVVAIFFNDSGFDAYPFDDPVYRQAYHELAELLAERDASAIIVRSQATYIGDNRFSSGWEFRDGVFVACEGSVIADIVFNRGNFVPRGAVHMLNHPDIERLCTDKYETWKRFPTLFPRSVVAENVTQAEEASHSLEGEMLVAKPIALERGIGVLIGPREEVLKNIPSYPYLLQEFIDTSGGIPDIAKSFHDLRVIIAAGLPVIAYVREPQGGSFVANQAQGGKCTFLPLMSLPEDVMTLCAAVDTALQEYPDRLYSVDMGRNIDGRWQLIELNSKPGLEPLDASADAPRYLAAIADILARKK